MSTFTRIPFATALAAALGLAVATTAQAQVAGTYTGTTSQGDEIDITIVDDGSGGFALTGDVVYWTEDCHTGDQKFTAWGIGTYFELGGNPSTYTFASQTLYEVLKMHFSPDGQTVHGTFQGMEPTFVDVNQSRSKVEQCHSGTLTYNATLQAGAEARASHPPLARGQALRLSTDH
jgi:hypothetical protein